MAKPTYVADVALFDGRTLKKLQGVLFGAEGVEWVGAHARAPKRASEAREVEGVGKTLMPGLIDVHVHLQFANEAKTNLELGSDAFTVMTPATAPK